MNKRGNNRAGRLVCGLLACVLIAAALPAAVWADEAAQPPAASEPAVSEPAGGELLPPAPEPQPSASEQPADEEPAPEQPADEPPLPPQEQQPEPSAGPQESEEAGPAAPARAPAAAAANGGAEPALRAGSADELVSGQNEEQEFAPRSGDEQEEPQTARCTVIYWGEGLGEEAIFLYRAVNEQAPVGSTVKYQTTLSEDQVPDGFDMNGFALDPALTGEAPVVTADGQTVMNVYFSRKTFAITFLDRYGQKLGEIQAKYGADISAQWQDRCADSRWGTAPYEGSNLYTMFSNMPAENITVYQRPKGEQPKKIIYYIQALDGSRIVYATFYASSEWSGLTKEDKQPITGFTFSAWGEKETDNPLWLYYTRNEYTLHLVNGTGETKIKLLYEAPVAGTLPEPQPPQDADPDSEFAGWYLSKEDGSQPFSSESVMPAHDLFLYARWQPPVMIEYVTGREDLIKDPQKAHRGDLLWRFLPDASEMGSGFLGWYTDPERTQPVIETQKLTQDLTLYAKWEAAGPTDPPEPTDPPGPTATPAPATPGGSNGGTSGSGSTAGTGGANGTGAAPAPDTGRAAAAVQSTPAPLAARPAAPAVPAARPETPDTPAEPLTDPAAPLAGPEAAQTGPAVMRITIENPDGSSGGIDLGEETTPLAGPARHEDCVMHHLILLAALVLELIFFSLDKKAQQRIFNARIELAEYKARHPES